MTKHTEDAMNPAARDLLHGWMPASAILVRIPAGQVLVYEGHVAPGIHVVLSGSVRSSAAGTTVQTLSAPCVVPIPSTLGEHQARALLAGDDLQALFVPRSVVLLDSEVRAKLEQFWRQWNSPRSTGVPENK